MPDYGAGSLLAHRLLAAATTNATLVKSAPGQLCGWFFKNNAAYDVFIKFYNSATIPTAGVGTPVLTFPVPAGAAANLSLLNGVGFSLGIGYTITKLVADNDTTVVVANDLVVNLFYS